MLRTPVELEVWKYNPTMKFPRSSLFAQIFGFFCGINIYLYYTRIYQDEFKLR